MLQRRFHFGSPTSIFTIDWEDECSSSVVEGESFRENFTAEVSAKHRAETALIQEISHSATEVKIDAGEIHGGPVELIADELFGAVRKLIHDHGDGFLVGHVDVFEFSLVCRFLFFRASDEEIAIDAFHSDADDLERGRKIGSSPLVWNVPSDGAVLSALEDRSVGEHEGEDETLPDEFAGDVERLILDGWGRKWLLASSDRGCAIGEGAPFGVAESRNERVLELAADAGGWFAGDFHAALQDEHGEIGGRF